MTSGDKDFVRYKNKLSQYFTPHLSTMGIHELSLEGYRSL
jgi:hypothetical protein